MVYIKLPTTLWTLSGLQRICNKSQIINIDNTRYIAYNNFKSAAQKSQAQIHNLVRRENIISNLQMKKIMKIAEKTPEQKKMSEELRSRHELRLMSTYSAKKGNYYFQEKKDESVKDLSKSISFGLTFIFSFFMAGLTGYYFGIYFLSLQFVHALVVAIIFIIVTIVIETSLFIIKQNRDDQMQRKKRKKKSALNYKEQTSFANLYKQQKSGGQKSKKQ